MKISRQYVKRARFLTFFCDRLLASGIILFDSIEKFLQSYPNSVEFPHDSSFDQFERFKLFQFANYMKIVVYLLNKAEGHRDHAVELAVRLTEGRHARYTFGSGSPKRGLASPSLRRKSIYWQEGGDSIFPFASFVHLPGILQALSPRKPSAFERD